MRPNPDKVVDKVDRKKRLIGGGFVAIGLMMMSMGPWQLALPWGTRHTLLIPYLVAEGAPLLPPPPDPRVLARGLAARPLLQVYKILLLWAFSTTVVGN